MEVLTQILEKNLKMRLRSTVRKGRNHPQGKRTGQSIKVYRKKLLLILLIITAQVKKRSRRSKRRKAIMKTLVT